MPSKKICIITSVHTPFDIRIFHKECKTLARFGFEVYLIANNEKEQTVENVKILPLGRRGRNRFSRAVWSIGSVLLTAKRLNADLYHIHDPELIFPALILRAVGKRVIYDVHENITTDILSKYYLPVWSRKSLSWVAGIFELAAARTFNGIITATPHIAEKFKQISKPVKIVQNYPILDEFSLLSCTALKNREARIAYIGSISERRGILEIVRALEFIPENSPLLLDLAGPVSPAGLHDQLAAMPGWKRVIEHGILGRPAILELLGNVRAGLALYRPVPGYPEAYSTKMFEYMASGIPVIASDFPLWRRIITETGSGILVDPMDPKAIAGAIEYILANPDKAEEMGNAGRVAFFKKYNWNLEQQKLLALYQTILQGAGQP